MGAKKDKDVATLTHKVNKFQTKVQKMREFNVNEAKIAEMEEKQERYEAWLEEIEQMNDY